MERPKRSTRTQNRKRKHFTESDANDFDDEIRDKDFVLNSSENDCGSDKGNKSSHVTDEEDPHRRNLQILLHNIQQMNHPEMLKWVTATLKVAVRNCQQYRQQLKEDGHRCNN